MIHVFSIMWNEETLLPYWLRHYETLADRIFIFNDHSTDATAAIAQAHPKVTLLDYQHEGLKEQEFNDTFSEAYRRYSRAADWVMCVDGDEFVYHNDLPGVLKNSRGVLKTQGYMMFARALPKGHGQIYDELNMGLRTPSFDKPIIFEPKLDISFGDGRHSVSQPVVQSDIKLLHYKYPSRDYYLQRNTAAYPRVVDMDDNQRAYRIRRGLATFDASIDKLERVV